MSPNENQEGSGRTGRLVLALLLGFLAGCASRGGLSEDEPLPFHVAVVPATRVVTRLDVGLEPSGDERKPLEIRLDLPSDVVSRSVVEALDGAAFVKATLLSYPEGQDAESFRSGYQPLERADYWSAQAKECGADVILTCNLEYDSQIGGEINDWFWINHLIYLFGGPLCWIPNDRSYRVQGSLTANLYDSSLIYQDPRSFGEARAELLPLDAGFEEVSLDFLDRAPNFGTYALGLFLPSGWLARQNDKVKSNVEAEVVDRIIEELGRSIRESYREINEARSLVNFHIDLATVRVTRDAPTRSGFTGDVILRTGRGVTRLDAVVLEVGGHAIRKELTAADRALVEDLGAGVEAGASPVYRYRIEERLDHDGASDVMRVTILQGGQPPARRSYTFRLSGSGPRP